MRNRREILLGGVTFDPETRDLRDEARKRVELRNKSSEVLAFLASRPGQILAKSDVMDAVWPEIFVSDESVTQCVADIRRAIGDRDQGILKTHVGKGYSLTAPKTADGRRKGALMTVAVLSVIVVAAGVVWSLSRAEPSANASPGSPFWRSTI